MYNSGDCCSMVMSIVGLCVCENVCVCDLHLMLRGTRCSLGSHQHKLKEGTVLTTESSILLKPYIAVTLQRGQEREAYGDTMRKQQEKRLFRK